MRFRNKTNGHVVTKSSPWLWVLIFGGFYFLFSGVWIHFILTFILGALLIGSQGGGGVVMMMVVGMIYAAFADSIIRSHYLSKGWEEVEEGESVGTLHGTRKCPFCAEEIRPEAVKCKHCGSDVEPLPAVGVKKEETPPPTPQNFTLG